MTDMAALKGRFYAWDMGANQRQHAMLAEEVRKLKLTVRLDASPGDVQAGPPANGEAATTPLKVSEPVPQNLCALKDVVLYRCLLYTSHGTLWGLPTHTHHPSSL